MRSSFTRLTTWLLILHISGLPENGKSLKWLPGILSTKSVRVVHTLITVAECNAGTTVCRVWSKYETRETFYLLFRFFFEAIENATGKELKLRALHPSTGTMHGFAADGAIAQAMGLSDAIVRLKRSDDSILRSNNPKDVPNCVMRTCFVHYTRSALSIFVPYTCLNMIARNAHALRPSETNGITSELYGETVGIYHIIKPEEYEEYAERCRTSPSEGIKSEYMFCRI